MTTTSPFDANPKRKQAVEFDLKADTSCRLNVRISEDLHSRIKVKCALDRVSVQDAVAAVLEEHFGNVAFGQVG